MDKNNDRFDNLNEIYNALTSKANGVVLNEASLDKLRALLNDDMIDLLKSIQKTFISLNGLKDKDEIHDMIQRKIDPQSNRDTSTLISATAQSAANIMNNIGIGAADKAALLKSYTNALHIINKSVAIDGLSPEAALTKAVDETGLSKETLKALGLFTSPFMGIVDLTVLGGFISAVAIASPFVLLQKTAKFINTKYNERQERIAKEIEEQNRLNPELYLNIPIGLIISDIDADIKKIESKAKSERDAADKQNKENAKRLKFEKKMAAKYPQSSVELPSQENPQIVQSSQIGQRLLAKEQKQSGAPISAKPTLPRSMTNQEINEELKEEFNKELNKDSNEEPNEKPNEELNKNSFNRLKQEQIKEEVESSMRPPAPGPRSSRGKESSQSEVPPPPPPPGQPFQIRRRPGP